MSVSPCRWKGSFVEPFRVKNSELIAGSNPLPDAQSRLFEIADGQVNQLGRSVICWKAAAGFGGFSDHPVQALDCIRRVDDLAHGWREGKERDDLLPSAPPAWGY